jgi:uncharacterized protein YcfJ
MAAPPAEPPPAPAGEGEAIEAAGKTEPKEPADKEPKTAGSRLPFLGALTGSTARQAEKEFGRVASYSQELGHIAGKEHMNMLAARGAAGLGAAAGLHALTRRGEPKTAADKTPPTDHELRETGRQRAVTQLSAEAHRERGRRNERIGETFGRAAGALAGAGAGRKFIGGRLGTVAGLAAGMGVGGKAGKEVGAERDIHKNAAAMKFSMALRKLGFGAPVDQYMASEIQGQEAQQQNEAEFYRGRAQSVGEQHMATQQALSDAQMQLQQLQEQQAQAGANIQAANDEALSASDESLRQTQLAANMRIGYQKMRQAIIEMASQDPEALGPPMSRRVRAPAWIRVWGPVPPRLPDRRCRPTPYRPKPVVQVPPAPHSRRPGSPATSRTRQPLRRPRRSAASPRPWPATCCR